MAHLLSYAYAKFNFDRISLLETAGLYPFSSRNPTLCCRTTELPLIHPLPDVINRTSFLKQRVADFNPIFPNLPQLTPIHFIQNLTSISSGFRKLHHSRSINHILTLISEYNAKQHTYRTFVDKI